MTARKAIQIIEDGDWWDALSWDMDTPGFDDLQAAFDVALTLLEKEAEHERQQEVLP